MPHCIVRFDLLFIKVLIICLFVAVPTLSFAQVKRKLRPNQQMTFSLSSENVETFGIDLKEGDFAEISWLANEELNLSITVLDPLGKNASAGTSNPDDSISFIAAKSGEYTVTAKFGESQEASGTQQVTLQYADKLKLPANISRSIIRKINGLDVKILESEKEGVSLFLIEKQGRLKAVMKGAGGIGGFHFADDLAHAYDVREKRSARLMAEPDKTGDGTPDIAVVHYSGGAHCCFTTYFFELGDTVREVPPLATANASVSAIGKNLKGGLRLQTGDDTFAYWLTGFAQSPIPVVVLEFRDGAFRPNLDLMRKPAPSLAMLREQARVAREKLSLDPYKGIKDPDSNFENAFWDVMLDLIYTGHEDLAWQYLDLVWPVRKPGKAIFRADFEEQLSQSEFWQMIVEAGKPVKK